MNEPLNNAPGNEAAPARPRTELGKQLLRVRERIVASGCMPARAETNGRRSRYAVRTRRLPRRRFRAFPFVSGTSIKSSEVVPALRHAARADAGLHVTVALYHRFVRRDRVLERMRPVAWT